jgi:hypothetical protein
MVIALMPPKELKKQTRRERINPRLNTASWKVTRFDPGVPVDANERSLRGVSLWS